MKQLTKDQYDTIANVMRYTYSCPADNHGQWAYIVLSLADDLSVLDNQFDRKKFYELCGLDRDEPRYLADGRPGYYDANGNEVAIR